MTAMSEAQLRPYIRRFEDIREFCRNNNIKEAKKIIAEMEKKKKKPNNLPFLELYKGAFALGMKNVEEAIDYCQKIEQEKPNDTAFLLAFISLYRSTGLEEECIPLYKRLVALNPNKAEVITQAIICMLICAHYVEAQETAMQLVRVSGNEANYILCATCCYLRGLHEKPQFFAFAANFFKKAQLKQYDAIYMYIDSLIKTNKAQEALSYVQSENVQKLLSYDKMGLLRLEMDCHKALNQNEEVAKLAEKLLRTVNAESIDEWRLVVAHHPNPQQVIQDLSKGKRRGPKIAEIDLALKQQKDASELIVEYANSRPGVGYLFGDLRKYVNDGNRAKLTAINDQGLHEYITGEFIGDVTNSRTAVIKAESLLKKYLSGDKNALKEAASVCAMFEEAPECRLMLIRIAAILGATNYLGDNQVKLKLEAIQYLSLGHVYIEGLVKMTDIDEITRIANATESFCFNSITGFNQFFQKGIDDGHYMPLYQAAGLRHEIMNHRMRYINKAILLWCEILQNNNISESKYSLLKTAEEVEKLINKTDETALPLYADGVHDLIYPETLGLAKGISAITRSILAKDDKEVSEILSKDFPDGCSVFTAFLRDGTVPKEATMFLYASMYMFAKRHGKNTDQIITALDEFAAKKVAEIEQLPEPFNKTIDEQKKRLEKTINTIKQFK